MKTLAWLASWLLAPSALLADSWGPPTAQTYLSSDSNVIVRVEPGAWKGDVPTKTTRCRFFRYSQETEDYVFWREHDLVNQVSPADVVVPNDGSYLVTFDDYFGVGTSENTVVVYDSSGKITKRWALDHILSRAEIEQLPRSTSSIHWRSGAGIMYEDQNEVYMSAPKSSFESDKDKRFKSFRLDVKALTIKADPPLSPSPDPNKPSDLPKWIALGIVSCLLFTTAGWSAAKWTS